MSQQINLYSPIFRKQEKKFSAKAMAQASAALVVGIIVIFGVLLWQTQSLRRDLQHAEQQHVALTKQLEQVTQKFGIRPKSKLLEEERIRLEKQLNAMMRVQEILRQGVFTNTRGYSSYFLAFARQHVSGLWLTGFDVSGAGEELTLQGRSTDPALVPRYVQRLAAEESLTGAEFQVFKMSRPILTNTKQPAPYIEFVIKTGPLGELKAAAASRKETS